MRALFIAFLFFGTTFLLVQCKGPDVPATPTFFLKTMVESRYMPNDSATITYQYDQTNRLQWEVRKHTSGSIRIIDLYDPNEKLPVATNSNVQYRRHNFNAQNQEISLKKHFRGPSNYWAIYYSDSLIYAGNRLVGLENKDYFLGQYGYEFPLWLTKRSIAYDSQNRIATETDSVFITHDIPIGTFMLTRAPATHLHTNKTTYTYDEKGMVIKAVAVSGDEKKPMRYSNSSYILSPYGNGGYATSFRQLFYAGITTYTYEYNANDQLIRKIATYTDEKTGLPYVSAFRYEYGLAD